ncbi:hypothetical protein [Pseudomonas sp. RIT-PI-q]|jgi:hypothetical protein|uniref:hypothetical protein n=1 Tax=Pseudomonas sp. RIT-PI-q TaxID=1690247 RepID=UPI00128EBDE7|nr:hypothetical protein [Pseudomonas sp. RIT-PI-q]
MKPVPVPVKIAKITAFQSILVAVITAVGGLAAAGYIGRATVEPQRWLTIESVESNEFRVGRIVVEVNGLHFSYPSTAVWAEFGAGMSREKFSLPRSSDGYRISFRAFLSNPGASSPTIPAESQVVETIASFPTNGLAYSLHPSEGSYKSANSVARVLYHVE